jgi:sugar-specific transcriptional regulator TrmB
MDKTYLNVKEVMLALGISRDKAYKIIRRLNEELKAQGFITIAGKCSRKYFAEKCYGYEKEK